MPKQLSSKAGMEDLTLAMQEMQLLPLQRWRCPKRPDVPDSQGLGARAPPPVVADHTGSPTTSTASSSGSVSLWRLAPAQDCGSPTASTGSSCGSISFQGRCRQPQPEHSQLRNGAGGSSLLVNKHPEQAQSCLSSTKGPAAHRAPAACLSSSKPITAHQALAPAAAASTQSPTPSFGQTDAGTPGLSIDYVARPAIPFQAWLAGMVDGAVASPAADFQLPPSPDGGAPDGTLNCDGRDGAAAAVTPAPAQGHAHRGPGRGLWTTHRQPPSAGLSPATEPAEKVAFSKWWQNLEPEEVVATPCTITPGGADPCDGAPGSAPQPSSSAGFLSTASQVPEAVPFAEWLKACQASSPASPLLPLPFLMRPESATRGLVDGCGDGAGGARQAAAANSSPNRAVAAAAARAEAVQTVRTLAAGAPRARLTQVTLAAAGVGGGGRGLPGSPVPCRRAALPLSPC